MSEPERDPPRVWAVMGYRAGENSQIQALAEALHWPVEIKRLAHRPRGFVPNLLRRVTLSGIRIGDSSPLVPPWPDLVISAGFRNEPVVRWIKAQAGDRCHIVHIGRPWAAIDNFDLVITTPQYRLPKRPNVLHNGTTLHRVTPERLQVDTEHWSERLEKLPAPRVAVLVGDSGPYAFGPHAARRLGREVSALVWAVGGSALVTTSARTDLAAADVLEEYLTVPRYIYRWQPDSEENPYYAFLALADRIVVTGDSIAMISEAVASGKPVSIFDLAVGRWAMRRPAPAVVPGEEDNDFKLRSNFYRFMMRFGPQRLSRDVTLVHEHLVSARRAVWLGDDIEGASPVTGEAVQRSVQRVAELLGPSFAPGAPGEAARAETRSSEAEQSR